MCVECCQWWCFLCKVHPEESFVAIYFGEFGGSCEDVCDLLKGWSFVMALEWWLYLGPSGQEIFLTCHLLFWVMSMNWPMVLVQSVSQWFPVEPSHQALFRPYSCILWNFYVFCVELVGLSGLFWCCILLTCHQCSQSCWGNKAWRSLVLLIDVEPGST